MAYGRARLTLEALELEDNKVIQIGNIIFKGAEANLYIGKWFDKDVLIKHRIPKLYRIDEIDQKIRKFRTIREARMLVALKEIGIPVPQVFEVDSNACWIIMKYIQGEKLKNFLEKIDSNKRTSYFTQIGKYVALMHKNNFIHGDLTTSNIIITEKENIFFIDFGLANRSEKIEDKSIDLHLFKRVLMSTHGSYFSQCYDSLLNGYKEGYFDMYKEVFKRIEVIESRGRYIEKKERHK